jgi:hypothetical protein
MAIRVKNDANLTKNKEFQILNSFKIKILKFFYKYYKFLTKNNLKDFWIFTN